VYGRSQKVGTGVEGATGGPLARLASAGLGRDWEARESPGRGQSAERRAQSEKGGQRPWDARERGGATL
jgi:hypothetical protein